MKQIHADFNDITGDGVLPLTCQRSVSSIAALGEELRDGEEVRLLDGDLRVTAKVFRRSDGTWEGRSEWQIESGGG